MSEPKLVASGSVGVGLFRRRSIGVAAAPGQPTMYERDAVGRLVEVPLDVWAADVLASRRTPSAAEWARLDTFARNAGARSETLCELLRELARSWPHAAGPLTWALLATHEPGDIERVLREALGGVDSPFAAALVADAAGDGSAYVRLLDETLRADPDHEQALDLRLNLATSVVARREVLARLVHAGSWRAAVAAGGNCLDDGDPHGATAWFERALDTLASRTAGALAAIVNLPGCASFPREVIDLTVRHWVPRIDGPLPGMWLAEAAVVDGDPERADRYLSSARAAGGLGVDPTAQARFDRIDLAIDELRDRASEVLRTQFCAPCATKYVRLRTPYWFAPLKHADALAPPRHGRSVVVLSAVLVEADATGVPAAQAAGDALALADALHARAGLDAHALIGVHPALGIIADVIEGAAADITRHANQARLHDLEAVVVATRSASRLRVHLVLPGAQPVQLVDSAPPDPGRAAAAVADVLGARASRPVPGVLAGVSRCYAATAVLLLAAAQALPPGFAPSGVRRALDAVAAAAHDQPDEPEPLHALIAGLVATKAALSPLADEYTAAVGAVLHRAPQKVMSATTAQALAGLLLA